MYADLVRKCKNCGEEKNVNEFYKSTYKKKKSGNEQSYRAFCKPCEVTRHREYVRNNRERVAEYRRARYRENKAPHIEQNLKRYYGIDLEKYNRMFNEQGAACAICKTEQSKLSKRLFVDHCHKTKKVRGLLCIKCNRALGLLDDNQKLFKSAIAYLKKNKN